MRDLLEKYLIIQQSFPDKAGKLASLLAVQKRLITKLLRSKQTDEVKELISAVAEGYDVTTDLMEWNKGVLQGVLNDAEHLAEGAKYRNVIAEQSELLSFYMDNDQKSHEIRLVQARKDERLKAISEQAENKSAL